MTTTNNLGLYLHIPFCVRKCKYCDFLSFGCSDSKLLSEYAQALMQEIKIKSEDWRYREVDSIFIGGGTPSLISEWDMGAILDRLRDSFNVTEDVEITIEANPATLSDEKLKRYLWKGINRISIGVQSFDNRILQTLGRIHNKNDAFYSFQRAKKAGFKDINLDIMFGVPGQTMKIWKDTVRQCTFLGPSHISLYSLQIEKETEFYKMIYEDGTLDPISDLMDRKMYHTALQMLKAAGYEQYEISNTALTGHKSRHNMKYWSYEEYLGLGLGASSFIDGSRFQNYSKMYEYINAIKQTVSPVDPESIQTYSEAEEMGIFVFTGLRKTEGISLQQFRKIFKKDFFDVYDEELIIKYQGKLMLRDGRLYLSSDGMDLSNVIMAEFV